MQSGTVSPPPPAEAPKRQKMQGRLLRAQTQEGGRSCCPRVTTLMLGLGELSDALAVPLQASSCSDGVNDPRAVTSVRSCSQRAAPGPWALSAGTFI